MAILNNTYRYIFLAEKHTASRVLRDVLLQQHTASDNIAPHHITLPEIIYSCPTVREFPSRYKTFSVIRNPADILVTMHFANTFQEFIRHTGSDPNCIFFKHIRDADAVMHYEHLEDDLNDFFENIGAPKVTIPYKKEYVTGGKKPWPAYYEEEDIEFIIKAYPEIRYWGYEFIIRKEWEQWQSLMTNGTSSS